MEVGPFLDPALPVYDPDPVNRQHNLIRGRVGWWLCRPNTMGLKVWPDVMGLNHAIFAAPGSGQTWSTGFRPGGAGELYFGTGSSYVTLAGSPSLAVAGDLTIALSANFTSVLGGGSNTLVGGYKATSPFSGYGLRRNSSSSSLEYWDGTAWRVFGVDAELAKWRRLVVSVIGTTATLYRDGLAVGSAACTAVASYVGQRCLAAAADGGTSAVVRLDDVSINARGWSAAEAWQDYDLSRQGNIGLLNRYVPSTIPFGTGGGGGPSNIFAPTNFAASNVASSIFLGVNR